MQQKVRNIHLITGEVPQKSLVTLAPDPEHGTFFPTERKNTKISTPCPTIKEELFFQELFFYENMEIKKKPDSTANSSAGSQENKRHMVKMIG